MNKDNLKEVASDIIDVVVKASKKAINEYIDKVGETEKDETPTSTVEEPSEKGEE